MGLNRSPRVLAALALGAALAPPSWAEQAYERPGQLPVMEPAAQPAESEAHWDNLRKALARAKNPRIALYWNRALSDRVTTDYDTITAGRAAAVATSAPGVATLDVAAAKVEGTRANRDSDRAALIESEEFRLEGAFKEALLKSGMKLVDRNMLLRKAGLEVNSDKPNVQKLEMQALRKDAEYLLEVLTSVDASRTDVAQFRVSLKDLRTGTSVVEFATEARLPEAEPQWVATNRGFEKQSTAEPDKAEDRGRQLGRELADRLARTW